MLSEADLTVYSTSKLSLDDLKKLISTTATIKISQKKTGNSVISRYYSGMIRSIKHCGTAQVTPNGTVCRYMLTIASPLTRLQYAFPRRHSTQQSVEDLLTEILRDHHITAEIPPDLPAEKRTFNQGKSSDYDFLLRLFGEYNLNYIFKSSDNLLTEPQMHIFTTLPETASVVQPDPNENILKFHCGSSGDDVFAMTSWEMSSSAGIDEVEVHYENTDGRKKQNSGSAEQSGRKKIFNTAPFGMMGDEQVKDVAASLLAFLGSSKECWTGTAASLYAMPGMRINVEGFGSEETIETLITASILNATAAWPDDLGAGPNVKPSITVELRGCAPSAEEKRLVTAESDITSAMTARFNRPAPAAGTVEVFPGTVCSADGKTEPRDAKAPLIIKNDEDTYAFYALTDNDRQIVVQLTMPLGGYKQGLFRVPRLGERILMQSDGNGRYYLHAYLPNTTDMPFTDALKGSDETDGASMTVLRHCAPGFVLVKSEKKEQYNTMPDYKAKDRDPALRDTTEDHTILVKNPEGGPGIYDPDYIGAPNRISEFGIYSERPTSPEDGDEASEETPLVGDHVKMISNGRIYAYANKDVNIQAKDLYFSTPGWRRCTKNDWQAQNGKVKISGINSLEIEASDSMELKVLHNLIEMTPSCLGLRATKWSGSRGPLDASIYMNGMGGVSVTGTRVNAFGFFGVSMGDIMGAGLTAEAGSLQLRGTDIEFATNPKHMIIANLVKLGANLGIELGFIIARATMKDEEKQKALDTLASDTTYFTQTAFDTVMSGIDTWHDCWSIQKKASDEHKRWAYARAVLSLIGDMIDAVWQCTEATGQDDWMNRPVFSNDGTFTWRDCLRLCAVLFKLSAWGIVIGLTIATMKSRVCSYIQMNGEEWAAEADKIFELFNKHEDNHSVVPPLLVP